MSTTLSPLCRRRFMRHFRKLNYHISRGKYKKAEQCILEYQRNRSEPESEWERWYDLVDLLLADLPYLHANEPQFLRDILERLDRGGLPTHKQAGWIEKIARRTGSYS